ncbi:type VII secretion protein EccB [Micromonospora arborensis]|uniref:Type VII secretion protein EccB n=1 Tax=Micromonospora arborensis TaxID=2116518 RepID=A0A318NB76_9ACTN|nr:type VII secretion protein EccB [Micromonospora arborensis]PYC64867.1 type VII secretion protein EccB [Micromonospora arborensis]
MQSRRDQVEAQTYVLGRLTGALVGAEPDGLENPNRRMVLGTIVGVLVAALVVVGFTVVGALFPGGASSWRQPGVLVVEKETGTRYVYVDGLLRPVLNYTSARMLFGKEPKVVTVSRKSMREVAHGQPLGIVGAPDALPTAGTVDQQVWTVCAVVEPDQAGTVYSVATLHIESSDGPRDDRPLTSNQAILVKSEEQTFLVWQGRRLRLTQPWLTRVLGFDGGAFPVWAGWLESVPVGPDIGPPDVPGRGKPGPMVDGRQTLVGELFTAHTPGNPERHYLLQQDGLAELTPFAFTVAAADPETAKAYAGRPVQPSELSPGALATLPVSRRPALAADLPTTPPRVAATPDQGTWCVRQSIADGQVEVTVDLPVPPTRNVEAGAGVTFNSRTVNAVAVAPGLGGLVLAGRASQAAGSGLYLLTDTGVKYPVGSAAVAAQLGFPTTVARPVPRRLLEMLPTGPLLDPSSARG